MRRSSNYWQILLNNMFVRLTYTIMQIKKYAWILCTGIVLLCASCSEVTTHKSIKLAHSLDVTHSVHQGMAYMAERVYEKSGGQLRIEIYPNGQLGSERQCLELLQIGSLGMTKVSAAVMENFSPKIQIFSLPYIFKNRAHAYTILDGDIGKQLLVESEQFRLRGLAYFDAGYRSFYTKTPIRTPEDVIGKKIRVQESITAMNLVRSFGGSPTPIAWGELYTALQQGVVDGAENNPPSFYLSRHYEVCKYYSLNEHTAVPDILVIGIDAWNRLNAEEQKWLLEAADEATVKQRELWQKSEKEALDAVVAAGVEIIRPDQTLFADKTNQLFEDYKDKPTFYQLIQQIQAIE